MLKRVDEATVAVEKQYVLDILVCVREREDVWVSA
jgi:hypothetical protein